MHAAGSVYSCAQAVVAQVYSNAFYLHLLRSALVFHALFKAQYLGWGGGFEGGGLFLEEDHLKLVFNREARIAFQ